MVDNYILKIDNDIPKDDFHKLLGFVSDQKKERIRRFHRFEDSLSCLLGDVLARYAICKRFGIRNRELVFGTNDYGKPILLEPNGIDFNISHSENWVVCAVDNNNVGLDIENIKPIDFKIAERFFSRDEYISLISQPAQIKLKYFYMIWTLKESFIKAEGRGLSIPLNSFTIRIESKNICAIMDNKVREYNFYHSFLNNKTSYAICTQSSSIGENTYRNIECFLEEVKNTVLFL